MANTVKLSRFIFNTQDGSLNDDAKFACQILHIDPTKLLPKTLQDFQEGNVTEQIAQMRLDYYEGKRRNHTKQIEETIRWGFLDDFKAENVSAKQLNQVVSRTTSSPGGRQYLGSTGKQPPMSGAGYTQQLTKTSLPPDIMLRDPLDHEFVLNRKMAKKFYESQLQQRMSENRNKVTEDMEERKKKVADKESKMEKQIAQKRKIETDYLKEQIKSRQEIEQERRRERTMQARETAARILRDARQEERQRMEIAQKKQEEQHRKLEEAFERDRTNLKTKEEAGNRNAAKEKDFEKEIVTRLIKTENTLTQKLTIKEEQIRQRQEAVRARQERVREQLAAKEALEKKNEEEQLLKVLNKMSTVQKTRETTQKAVHARAKSERIDHGARLHEIKLQKEEEQKEAQRKIKRGIKQREQQVQRNLSYLKEENERRKEVKHLHKIDQEDNLNRKKAFERMGLENRVQMILEKASRVQRPAF